MNVLLPKSNAVSSYEITGKYFVLPWEGRSTLLYHANCWMLTACNGSFVFIWASYCVKNKCEKVLYTHFVSAGIVFVAYFVRQNWYWWIWVSIYYYVAFPLKWSTYLIWHACCFNHIANSRVYLVSHILTKLGYWGFEIIGWKFYFWLLPQEESYKLELL